MKLKLHEVELNAKDPEASKRFYHEILGLPLDIDQKGLKVFDSGWPGLDVDTSVHFPGQVSVSFLVDDLDQCVAGLRAKGLKVDDPNPTMIRTDWALASLALVGGTNVRGDGTRMKDEG